MTKYNLAIFNHPARCDTQFSFRAVVLIFIFFVTSFADSLVSASEVTSADTWIPGWKTTSNMTIARAGAAIVHHRNNIYMIGGVDGVNFLNSIEISSIQADGSLLDWRVISALPAARGFISAVVFNNRLYVVGGGNGPYGKNLLNSIVSASILKGGGLSAWRQETEGMLTPRRCSKIFIHENKLFALGGFGGGLLDTVEYADILSDGHLGEWRMSSNRLTIPRYVNSAKKIKNSIVAFGGHHPRKGVGIRDVEIADLSRFPLDWRTSSPMKQGRYAFSGAVQNNQLYALGGISGVEYLNSIEVFDINTAKWTQTSDLPRKMANFTSIVVKNKIYILGGSTRHKYMSTVWYADFNDSGAIGFWGDNRELLRYRTALKGDNKAVELPNSGQILQLIPTESYTYILVKTSKGLEWLAAPNVNFALNAVIQYSQGVYMSNFYSKTLARKFDSILFVGTVESRK